MQDNFKGFMKECKERIRSYSGNQDLVEKSLAFMRESVSAKYSYNFAWMGRPIIQYPQDMVAMQEIIWRVKPDLIIETGVAHGGSLIFYSSMLELIDKGHVLGIDVDIREHNRIEVEKHPMFKRITMIEGSSIDKKIGKQVYDIARGKNKVLVCLDSMHTQQHVIKELELYAPLVTKDSYCIVFDTIIEDMPSDYFNDRPWGKRNNPKTAVNEFLKTNSDFEIDYEIQNKLLITAAPDGYLKKIAK